MSLESKPLIQQAIRYLAVRNRSEHEIRQYFEKKSVEPNLIEEVITYLKDHGLINDQEFGVQWTHSRLRRQKGDRQIVHELEQKGISSSAARQTVTAIGNRDWFVEMSALIEKKQSKLIHLNSFQKKAKIYQLLAQRGYSAKLIDAFLRHEVE